MNPTPPGVPATAAVSVLRRSAAVRGHQRGMNPPRQSDYPPPLNRRVAYLLLNADLDDMRRDAAWEDAPRFGETRHLVARNVCPPGLDVSSAALLRCVPLKMAKKGTLSVSLSLVHLARKG